MVGEERTVDGGLVVRVEEGVARWGAVVEEGGLVRLVVDGTCLGLDELVGVIERGLIRGGAEPLRRKRVAKRNDPTAPTTARVGRSFIRR